MPRPLIAALALLALLLPIGGCYRYDARARNLTGHDIRVSIHKGSRKREVSTAVIGSGASVGWTGSFNGPVVMRVAQGGLSVDVPLPRRDHTEVQVSDDGHAWSIIKTVGDESFSIDPRNISVSGESRDEAETDEAEPADEPANGEEKIDLIEPDDG